MKMTIKYICAAFCLAAMSVSAIHAQDLRASYFMKNSLYRHYLNPALLDKPYAGALLSNVNADLSGNVGLKDFVYKLDGNPKYKYTTFMSPTVDAGKFLGDLHDNNRMDVGVRYNIASVAFKAFGGTNLVDLSLRSKTSAALPLELFKFMKTAGEREHYSIDDMGVRSQNYLELGFGHSRAIDEKLTVGAKFKLLFGLAYADMNVDHMDITMNDDKWQINADTKLKAAVLSSKFSYDDSKNADPNRGGKVDGLDDVSFGLPGFGMAIDLGATYKVMEGLTVSAALNDLGFISWGSTLKASSRGDYTFDGFKDDIHVNGDHGTKLGDQFEAIGDDLEEMFSVYDDGKGSAASGLTATLNLGAEYEMPFYKRLTAGFLYSGRFNGLYSDHMAMIAATVRPVNCFEASLNTSISSTGACLGGMLAFNTKGFNFFIGSDRIMGKVSKEWIPLNSLNASVSFGMSVAL